MGKYDLRSIKTKLLLGIAGTTLVLILLIVYSLIRWTDLKERQALILEKSIPAQELIIALNDGLEKANLLTIGHLSGNITSSEQLNELFETTIDSFKIELDTLISAYAGIELKNKYRRVDEGYVNIRQLHLKISSTKQEVQFTLPEISSYPGYMGDTLVVDADFLAWYQSQSFRSGSQSEGTILFFNELIPELRKLHTSLDTIYGRFDEERKNEERDLEALISRFILTLVISLIVLGVGGSYLLYRMVFDMISSINTVESQLNVLSKGDIPENLGGADNEFSKVHSGLKELSDHLLNVKKFAQEVGNGNFDNDIDVFNNEGDIGKSLSDVKLRLKNISEEDRKRNWSNQGFAQFGDILRSNADDLNQLADDIIIHLVKYLKANQGGIFILDEIDTDDPKMVLRGCYAYERKKKVEKEIRPGQGLAGQAWQEKESIYLLEVPHEYVNIKSGLGDSTPNCIFIVPLKVNNEVFGVIELASFQQFEEYEKEFVETLSESIASSISTVKINANTKTLLEESQQMTEEMRAQEEEMRQNMEELQATQEEMQRNSRDINDKEANLQALINNTDDSIITINRQYEVLVLNDQVRNRYKGTQYEGIDVGTNVLDMLGDVREEWKGYYDRAFAGDQLNFTIKSSVAGEETFRDYFINPIKNNSGEIVGASVFSRDVTQRELEKQESESKSAFLDLVEEITKLTSKVEEKEEIFQICLDEICNHMDWPIGHVYFPSMDQQTVVPSEIWYMKDDKAAVFKKATTDFKFKSGEGLPGRIWKNKEAEWIKDVTIDPEYPRIKSAEEAGLKGAFGFPVEMRNEVVAILEFYSYKEEKPDEEVLKLVKHVGTQMGNFIERLNLLGGSRPQGKDEGTVKEVIQQIKAEEEELKKKMKAASGKRKK